MHKIVLRCVIVFVYFIVFMTAVSYGLRLTGEANDTSLWLGTGIVILCLVSLAYMLRQVALWIKDSKFFQV